MRLQRWGALSVLVLLAVVATAIALPAFAGSGGSGPKLSKHDRALLAEARANGESRINVLVATNGGTTSVVAAIEGLGGTVGYKEDSLGYVRASLPLDKV